VRSVAGPRSPANDEAYADVMPPASSLRAEAPRERLDTPRVSDSERARRPSQRPTLVAIEPLPRESLPTPTEEGATERSPWREPASTPSPLAPEDGPAKWTPIVMGLATAFFVLLVLALLWKP